MKYLGIIIFSLFFCLNAVSQDDNKSLNFIISIDETIVVNSISRIHILTYKFDGSKEEINIDYIPGELLISSKAFEKLISEEIKSLSLVFDYSEYCKKKEYNNSYEIELQKKWLLGRYFILKIYNTNKKKYKRLFYSLEGKQYTYEYYSADGSVLKITKKKRYICN